MLRTQQITLCLILLTAVALSQRTITVTCRLTCPTNCSTNRCYDIVGSNYNQTVCANSNSFCSSPLSRTLTLSNCSNDYTSEKCPPGLCVQAAKQNFATPQACDSSYSRVIKCGTCVKNTSVCTSKLCRTIYAGSFIEKEDCVDQCFSSTTVNAFYGECLSGFDSFGKTSKCCVYFNQDAPVCISNLIFSEAKQLSNWAKPQTTTSVFEVSVIKILGVVLILCISIMIA